MRPILTRGCGGCHRVDAISLERFIVEACLPDDQKCWCPECQLLVLLPEGHARESRRRRTRMRRADTARRLVAWCPAAVRALVWALLRMVWGAVCCVWAAAMCGCLPSRCLPSRLVRCHRRLRCAPLEQCATCLVADDPTDVTCPHCAHRWDVHAASGDTSYDEMLTNKYAKGGGPDISRAQS